MKLLKVFILAVLFVSIYSETFSQDFYFTYSSPSSITIPYGANSVNATYTFTYYYPEGVTLIRPKLSIQLDGNTIAGPICVGADSYLPSSYTFNLTAGVHTIKLTLSDLGQQSNSCTQATIWQVVNISVTPKFTVRNENIFTYGNIYVDNLSVSKSSPFDRTSNTTNNYQIGAIDQLYGGYNWVWNNSGVNNSDWRKQLYNDLNKSFLSNIRNTAYTVQSNDNSTKLIAGLRKVLNVNFQNSFVGVGNGGVINVNNTQYNSPTSSFSVVELNPINALPANGQIINGIVYNFSKWSDGNTTANRTFNPSVNATYTAQYIGKPATYDPNTGWSLNLHHSTTVGEPIVLYWNEHPNTYVTKYQIWKKEKYNGVTSDPILMATVNRGTTSFVDNDFVYSLLKNKYWIYYAVVPYYSLENTYSDLSWMPVTAEINYKSMDSTYAITSTVLENSLSNFPNPFNPTTNINFSIKEPGFVNIRVFDLIGQQVAELVNEEKQAGSYSIRFDASKLPSGIYIYTINSGAYSQTRKMLLMK